MMLEMRSFGAVPVGAIAAIRLASLGRLRCVLMIALLAWLTGCVDELSSPYYDPASQEQALTDSLAGLARDSEAAFDYQAAAGHFARLIERLPDEPWVVVAQARNLRYLGRPRDALKVLRVGMVSHGEEPLLLELAKAQFAAAMVNDSYETLLELLETTPDDWQIHSMLGMMYDRQERYDDARESYERALALSPENPSVINNLGLSLAQSGQLDTAIETLEALVRGEESTLQARQNLAMLYVIRGDLLRARALASQDLPPDRVDQNLAAYGLMAR